MYTVKFTKIAEKHLRALDKRYQSAVAKAIDRLAIDPKVGEPLTGALKGLWKLRFLRYRIIYQIKERTLIVVIFEIGHRRDVYR